MPSIEAKLVDLDDMHVVAAIGYGADPETQAWATILEFLAIHQMDPWDSSHRFFGFHNPDPSPETDAYGYEQWVTVPADVDAEPPLEVKDIAGGRYAMVAIHSLDTIGESWQALAEWCEKNRYEIDPTRETCLEELLTPLDNPPSEWDMRLYLAVK